MIIGVGEEQEPFLAEERKGHQPDFVVDINWIGSQGIGANTDEWEFRAGHTWTFRRDGSRRFFRFAGADGVWERILSIDPVNGHYAVFCSREACRPKGGGCVYPLSYPLDQVLMMYLLAEREGMIIHAACIAHGSAGIVLAGPSGAGKSTLAAAVLQGGGLECLSDDRTVLLSAESGRVSCWGTPWAGEGGFRANKGKRAAAVVIIRRSKEPDEGCRLRRLEKRHGVEALIPVVSFPWFDGEMLERHLGILERIVGCVPIYELDCNDISEAVGRLLSLVDGVCSAVRDDQPENLIG